MPSFRGEVKPSVPCHRFAACKRSVYLPWKSHVECKIGLAISRPYFPPSLIEVSHVARRGAPLEMTGETKSGAQRACVTAQVHRGCRAPNPPLLYSTLCYLQENGMIINGNLERVLKEMIMSNLKIPSQHLTAGTDNYHRNPLPQ
jgi:hypothetical protein